MDKYLAETTYFDFGSPEVQKFAQSLAGDLSDPVEIAKAIYLGVRDKVKYNAYLFSPELETFKASHVVNSLESYCIPKAVLLGAVARYFGIPSRIGFADVKNHITSPKLTKWLRTDVFAMHGFIQLYLNEKWVVATPAFDKKLCDRLGVATLDFDGLEDSMFQQFDAGGTSKYMEYLNYYGYFSDLPVKVIFEGFQKHYPHLI